MRTRSLAVFSTFVVFLATLAAPVAAQQSGYYVLDGFGGVHAGGGAPVMSPATPYFGFDIAKGIAYVPPNPGVASGIDGIIVLDGFGGVHAGGPLKTSSSTPLAPATPYFGFNIARAIALRDAAPPRSNGVFDLAGGTITSATYVSVESVSIVAPRAGRLILLATGEIFCSGAGTAGARFSLNVDTTAASSVNYPIGVLDCSLQTPNTPADFQRSHNFTFTAPFSVSAGSHTAHLLMRNEGGSLNFTLSDVTMTVIFID